MKKARLIVYMIFLGAGAIALSLIVLVRNKSLDDELLATLGFFGGIAIILVGVKWAQENGKWAQENGKNGHS
jgi:hypothetical protein